MLFRQPSAEAGRLARPVPAEGLCQWSWVQLSLRGVGGEAVRTVSSVCVPPDQDASTLLCEGGIKKKKKKTTIASLSLEV